MCVCTLLPCPVCASKVPLSKGGGGAKGESHTFASRFKGDWRATLGAGTVCRAGLPGLERLSGVSVSLSLLQGFRRYFTRISQQEKRFVSNRRDFLSCPSWGEAARLDLPASQAPGFD